MKRHLKKYFIPHSGNNYHPHFLHTKRAILYSILFVGIKVFLVALVVLIPLPALVAPDVLSGEQTRLVALINNLRGQKNREPLAVRALLNRSSELKAEDMAVQQYFSHTGPDNHDLKYFLKQAGYSYRTAGENLAMGFFSADDVLAAWIKSPTHYQNLIDSEYAELGTSMVSGLYTDIPTAYAVAHFGAPRSLVAQPATTSPVTLAEVKNEVPAEAPKIPVVRVLSQKTGAVIVQTTERKPTTLPIKLGFDISRSTVGWKEAAGGILVHATVCIRGMVKNATVEIAGHTIPLVPGLPVVGEDCSLYAADQTLPTTKTILFRVVVPPTLTITGLNDEVITSSLVWDSPPIVSPTPWQRYAVAQRSLPLVGAVISFSNSLYIGFLLVFSLALGALIMIEIRRQHPHVIVQTLGVIALLLVLIIV
jgi:hypothetical protein